MALRKYLRKKRIKQWTQFYECNADTYLGQGFRLDVRHPMPGKKYLNIGKNCMIDGSFIFERDSGYISVGDRVHIGGSALISVDRIEIGDDVTIAWGCTIYDHNSHSVIWDERKNDTLCEYNDMLSTGDPIRNKNWDVVRSAPIKICNKAWLGMNVIVLKGVTIGEGAVVAAGSVVTKDVKPWTVVGGNPAQVIKVLEERK